MLCVETLMCPEGVFAEALSHLPGVGGLSCPVAYITSHMWITVF